MLMKSFVIAAAGLAATCHAFLLPTEVSDAEAAVANAVTAALHMDQKQSLSIDCPGCPMQVKGKHGRVRVKDGKQNHLELIFRVDRGADGSADRLLLNDFALYPNPDPFHHVLTAPQVWDRKKKKPDEVVIEEDEEEEKSEETSADQHNDDGAISSLGRLFARRRKHHHKKVVPPKLGFSLQIHPAVHDASGQDLQLVTLDLQIIEVGNRFVDGIPNVHVKMIKDAAGRLNMVRVEATASQTLRTAPDGSPLACNTLVCRWIEAFKAKMGQLRGRPCTAHHGHGATASEAAEELARLPGHLKRPGPHGLTPPELVRMHRHTLAHLFQNVLSHILLPILIGVVAGVSVSLIGMMVGTVLVFVWRTLFRRPAHPISPKAAALGEFATAAPEEKSGLMAGQELPPSYEADVPAHKVDI